MSCAEAGALLWCNKFILKKLVHRVKTCSSYMSRETALT